MYPPGTKYSKGFDSGESQRWFSELPSQGDLRLDLEGTHWVRNVLSVLTNAHWKVPSPVSLECTWLRNFGRTASRGGKNIGRPHLFGKWVGGKSGCGGLAIVLGLCPSKMEGGYQHLRHTKGLRAPLPVLIRGDARAANPTQNRIVNSMGWLSGAARSRHSQTGG